MPHSQHTPQSTGVARYVYMALGFVCVGLGAIGIILPVLPTTPFLIVAVWAFGRASPALAERIRQHHRYGPYIVAWETYGVIPTFAKVLAVVMMSASYTWIVLTTATPLPVKLLLAAILAALAIYIVTRPGTIAASTVKNNSD